MDLFLNINTVGFKISLESYVKCGVANHAEVPIIFGVRNEGIGTYLGIKCVPTLMGVFMSQVHLVDELVSKVGIKGKRPTISSANPKTYLEEMGAPFEDNKLYRSVIGILLWLGRCTRPDILFQTIALAQFQTGPTMVQWGAVQHLVLDWCVRVDLLLRRWPSKPLSS